MITFFIEKFQTVRSMCVVQTVYTLYTLDGEWPVDKMVVSSFLHSRAALKSAFSKRSYCAFTAVSLWSYYGPAAVLPWS